MKHRQWIAFSGFLWLAIGIFLLYKGLKFMTLATETTESLSFRYQDWFGGAQQAASFFIALALLIGWAKGRFVLSKTVNRVVQGISSLSLPIRFMQVYSRKYWVLMGSMIALGISLRFFPISIDVRGFVDVAVGSALIQGAILYFREARRITYGT